MLSRTVAVLLLASALCQGQMTREQKVADFLQLASVYAVNYGPLQWKTQALGVDPLNLGDWLDKVAKSSDDLDFYEVCVAYVASLNDAHSAFEVPSDFQARLGFDADIYDGKILIDSINRSQLSSVKYPFAIGDEVVSIDGVAPADLVQQFTKYAIAANDVSTRRSASELLTVRPQIIMPHAHQIGDEAVVVIRNQNGEEHTYSIPWAKVGTPLTFVGPVISPFLPNASAGVAGSSPGDYMAPLRRLRNLRLPKTKATTGFGALKPLFNMPPGFVVRMGATGYDSLYSGTFSAQGRTLGYIRFPDFLYYSPDDLENELAFMETNTDGLIIDVMHNPGGDACVTEDALKHFFTTQFRSIGLEIRATRAWVLDFMQALEWAQFAGAPDDVIQQYKDLLQQVENAYAMPSGRTPPLPVCESTVDLSPATDQNGNVIGYSKPIMVLTDEFTASAAEFFSAVMQDNQRARLFGARTMGAGGNVSGYTATTYSYGAASVTESLMSRKAPIVTREFPTAPYVENIGVRPDNVQEYATVDNLVNHGATFVSAFTDAMVQHIESGVAPREVGGHRVPPKPRR